MQPDELTQEMLKEFGPLMGGEALRRALGFNTWAAFARAVRTASVGIPVFEIPSRRGRFALTIDVARWLVALRANSPAGTSPIAEEPRKEGNLK